MNFYGFWNPSSGSYPSFDDTYKVGAFLVTQTGFFNNEKFKKGEWLVGIREENKLTWATASSMVNVPNSVNLNSPEAGFYTKIRLNNSGQIVDASTLEVKDLPKHSHTAEEVYHLKEELLKVVKEIFTDGMDSAVTFSVDQDTGNITADVDIDDYLIVKDSSGNLTVDVEKLKTSLPSTGGSSSVDLIELEDLVKQKISDQLKNITVGDQLVFDSEGFEDTTDSNTKIRTVKLKVDSHTITLNANRELTIAPDLLAKLSTPSGNGGGSGGVTGNDDYGHKCAAELSLEDLKDLKGFKEWLLEQVAKVFEFDIEDYIDKETIVLDENGKISAVAMKIQPHNHKISDVEGLEERLVPAAQQKVENTGTNNLDWTQGAINLTGSSIGVAIYYLNQKLKDNQDQIEALKKVIGKAQPSEPEAFKSILMKVQSTLPEVECFDLEQNKKVVGCYQGQIALIFTKVYPYNSGFIGVSIDGVEKEIDLSQFQTVNSSVEGLTLTKIEDFYKDLTQFTGWYSSGNFKLDLDLSEEEHLVQISWKDKDKNLKNSHSTVIRYVVPTETPTLEISFTTPKFSKKISGIPCCTTKEVVGEVVWKDAFTKRYIPTVRKVEWKQEENKTTLKPQFYSSKNIMFESFVFEYPSSFEGIKTLEFIYSLEKGSFLKKCILPSFRFDNSNIEEKYRVNWNPILEGEDQKDLKWSEWNSNQNLNSTSELPTIRGVAKNNFQNYSNFEGPDYSQKGIDTQFLELLLPLQKPLKRHSHFSSVFCNEAGESLPTNKLTGLFENFTLLIGLVSKGNVLAVLDGNKHYAYEELKENSRKFKSFDGFHSTGKVKTFTLGDKNSLENIDHILLKIGFPGNQSLDLNQLIDNFKGE